MILINFPDRRNVFSVSSEIVLPNKIPDIVDNMFLLTEWEGGKGKYLARGQDGKDRVLRSPCVLNGSQIFSRPARLHSVNKHFSYYMIIFLFHFQFFGGTRPRRDRTHF